MTIRSLALKTGLLLLFAIGSSAAQAPIDPSLPDAPLAHRQEIFLFSGYGSVMNPHKPVPPLTTRQKYKLAFVETVDLSMLLRAGFVSGFDEALNVGPDYGPGMGGFGKLYATTRPALPLTTSSTMPLFPRSSIRTRGSSARAPAA